MGMAGEGVTAIYIDLLLLLNFVANYLLLLGSGRMAGSVLRRPRIAAGAGVGVAFPPPPPQAATLTHMAPERSRADSFLSFM